MRATQYPSLFVRETPVPLYVRLLAPGRGKRPEPEFRGERFEHGVRRIVEFDAVLQRLRPAERFLLAVRVDPPALLVRRGGAQRAENIADPSADILFVSEEVEPECGEKVPDVRALRLEDVRFPIAYVMTCNGPPHGIQVERDMMNKYGRPLLGCTIKPKLGLSAKNYGRAVYECLRGGLDFTKDDENVNSQPFMRWRQRFDFVMDAVDKAEEETGERKGHYLNVTAPTPEEMYKRAEYAKELGAPIIMHDFITGGFCANTGLANWCRDNGVLLHIHRAMHAVLDRNPHHGIHFRVLTKILRLSGGDHLHTGTVVGKLEGDRASTLGWIDLLREKHIPEDRSRGIFFDQDWGSMPGVFAVASGGIHVWHMPALLSIFGDDSVLQFGGGTLGHPWGNAAGAAANRVALEACVEARNQGRPVEKEGREVLAGAARHSPELKMAMETWKEIKFEFDTVDKLDVAHK